MACWQKRAAASYATNYHDAAIMIFAIIFDADWEAASSLWRSKTLGDDNARTATISQIMPRKAERGAMHADDVLSLLPIGPP